MTTRSELFRPWVRHDHRVEQVLAYLELTGPIVSPFTFVQNLAGYMGISYTQAGKVLTRMEQEGVIRRTRMTKIEVLP